MQRLTANQNVNGKIITAYSIYYIITSAYEVQQIVLKWGRNYTLLNKKAQLFLIRDIQTVLECCAKHYIGF